MPREEGEDSPSLGVETELNTAMPDLVEVWHQSCFKLEAELDKL